MPWPRRFSMTRKRVSTSRGSSDEVGSSMMTTWARTETARASATICWVPMPSVCRGRLGSTRTPKPSRSSVVSRFIRAKSMSPKRFFGSRPRKMLRATLISGTRFTSW